MRTNTKKLGTNLIALGIAALAVLPTIVALQYIQPQVALSTIASEDVERDASYRGSGR
ncbi:MAG: hypothetical protein NZ772_05435 [Cyanobacteria bacterium]|nr:hypothetical protein [Cyanobacteriota bacterium]MDW8200960.1 hypothetical protein [Cyanobacteriota bacterium SKYGB_h_bin112]